MLQKTEYVLDLFLPLQKQQANKKQEALAEVRYLFVLQSI